MNETLEIYCDGACSGNPGPGGYAAAIVFKDSLIKYNSGYYSHTTNNRMELTGFLNALEMALNEVEIGYRGRVTIYTDSKYVENSINCGWIMKWARKGFDSIKNPDLWQEVYTIISKCDFIDVEWIKGHSGSFENDLVDRLAVEAMSSRRTSSGIIEI